MSSRLRIFLGLCLLATVALWLSLRNIQEELVPGMRQSLEEVLVDTANLLAVIVQEDVLEGRIMQGDFPLQVSEFEQRGMNAVIWFLRKESPNLVIYITDHAGIVIYDSEERDLGNDFSQWNDVYKTLRGEYGARTSRRDPDDDLSSVMYVAAPILAGDRIIGVLTVGKPSATVVPFVDAARNSLLKKVGWLFLLSVLLSLGLSFGLTVSIRRLTRYAQQARRGGVPAPKLNEPELKQLALAMEEMRKELDGKKYVEEYVQSLTHELKSPLAAIQGAVELLSEEMPLESRNRFLENIRSESSRLHQVVEKLLSLSALEARLELENVEEIQVKQFIEEQCNGKSAMLTPGRIKLQIAADGDIVIRGERFLLAQAVNNLLDNAINHSPDGGEVNISSNVTTRSWILQITNQGVWIPDYALPKIFDRFYSLPHLRTTQKGTGLGLPFVQGVTDLHGGTVSVANDPDGGVMATMEIPL